MELFELDKLTYDDQPTNRILNNTLSYIEYYRAKCHALENFSIRLL